MYTIGMSEGAEVQEKKPSVGPVGAVVVIVLIFIVGGVYFLVKQEARIRMQHQQTQQPGNS